MTTFIIGLVILIGGAALYGRFCEKVFGPDDRKTPAYTKEDGVDFVPMRGWKNSLINLLNIAGTGPIIGPIQGILFGPIAFITIPIGNIIGGAMHDYFSGMFCLLFLLLNMGIAVLISAVVLRHAQINQLLHET